MWRDVNFAREGVRSPRRYAGGDLSWGMGYRCGYGVYGSLLNDRSAGVHVDSDLLEQVEHVEDEINYRKERVGTSI